MADEGAKRPALAIMGDSISTFAGCNPEGYDVYYEGPQCEKTGVRKPSDTWWAQVAAYMDASILSNASFSGSMVSGAGFPAACSPQRIDALRTANGVPDAVLLFMGINDYGWGSAAAQAAGRSKATPRVLDLDEIEPRIAGRAAQGALEEFAQAYGETLAAIKRAYPRCDVWCCTLCPGRLVGRDTTTFAWRFRGLALDEYNDAIRQQARLHECFVADVRALGYDYEAIDGTHPTRRGMAQFAALVIDAINAEGHFPQGPNASRERDLCATQFEQRERSECRCERESCIACPHAKATGNAWFLVCEKPFS